jgi:hypothetical protein
LAIVTELSTNITVPVAPGVTYAVRSTTVPTPCGPLGETLNVVIEVSSDGDVEAELLADGPAPPALHATTLKV